MKQEFKDYINPSSRIRITGQTEFCSMKNIALRYGHSCYRGLILLL